MFLYYLNLLDRFNIKKIINIFLKFLAVFNNYTLKNLIMALENY